MNNQNKQEESKRYIDLSVEELDKEIKKEQEFANSCGVSEYTLKDIVKLKEQIERQKQHIKNKKQEYLESVKVNKQIMKETRQQLSEEEKKKESDEKFQENRNFLVKMLKDIKDNLTKDQDFYKEMESNNKISDQLEEHNKEVIVSNE